MTSLETLVLKGAVGDVESGLEQLRYTVLSDGIASNSDGMVSIPNVNKVPRATSDKSATPVRTAHLHLAHPTQRASTSH